MKPPDAGVAADGFAGGGLASEAFIVGALRLKGVVPLCRERPLAGAVPVAGAGGPAGSWAGNTSAGYSASEGGAAAPQPRAHATHRAAPALLGPAHAGRTDGSRIKRLSPGSRVGAVRRRPVLVTDPSHVAPAR